MPAPNPKVLLDIIQNQGEVPSVAQTATTAQLTTLNTAPSVVTGSALQLHPPLPRRRALGLFTAPRPRHAG